VRRGRAADAAALERRDTVVPTDLGRAESIDRWLREDVVFVAEVNGLTVGYGVFNHAFFRRGNVDMLMLHPDHRGRRIGERLLEALEEACDTEKLFITTNVSNHRMQRLLLRRGYAACGFVDELDLGDPELIFVKRLPDAPGSAAADVPGAPDTSSSPGPEEAT
jgi:GNAT superfamily N-acetyltransferase